VQVKSLFSFFLGLSATIPSLVYMLTRGAKMTSDRAKEPCITAYEPYITTKEPYMPAKEPHIPAKKLCTISKEPYVSTKEPYTSAKEPSIPALVCTLTRCGDMTCSAATTSMRATSTPSPTTIVRNSTWGRRYKLLSISPFISMFRSENLRIHKYVCIHPHTCKCVYMCWAGCTHF